MAKYPKGTEVEYVGESYEAFTKGKIYVVGGKYHDEPGCVGVVEDNGGSNNGLYNDKDFRIVGAGPVVTETVRRIKPGVYGRVEVRESRLSSKVVIGVTSEADNIAPFVSAVSAPELRELARVALEIAEYLEHVD